MSAERVILICAKDACKLILTFLNSGQKNLGNIASMGKHSKEDLRLTTTLSSLHRLVTIFLRMRAVIQNMQPTMADK